MNQYPYKINTVSTVGDLVSILQNVPNDYALSELGFERAILINHKKGCILFDETELLYEYIDELEETEVEIGELE